MKTISSIILLSSLFLNSGFTARSLSHEKVITNAYVSELRVSESQVIAYLVGNGYTVMSADPIGGSCNWICDTYKFGIHYSTTVFTDCSIITGHEDIDL